jgi:hypothetical protein
LIREERIQQLYNFVADQPRLLRGRNVVVVCEVSMKEVPRVDCNFVAVVAYANITDVGSSGREDRAPLWIGFKAQAAPGKPFGEPWEQRVGYAAARHLTRHKISCGHEGAPG